MKNFSRILVALDRSPMDSYLIGIARRVSDLFGASKVYFVHIIPDLGLSKSARAEFQKRFEAGIPIDEQVKALLQEEIQTHWGPGGTAEWSLDVPEGKPFEKLLHWQEVKQIDLLIIGQKSKSLGSGITARKLANQSRCHVLFVPETSKGMGKRILVPVDFSEDSAKALKLALQWKSMDEEVQVTAFHVTDLLATGYYLNRQEYENFNRFLADTAKDSFREFLKENQIPENSLEVVILRNDEGKTSERILEYARENGFDWIIAGAQGHGAIERFFFGSVTEKLVSQALPAPTLVVR